MDALQFRPKSTARSPSGGMRLDAVVISALAHGALAALILTGLLGSFDQLAEPEAIPVELVFAPELEAAEEPEIAEAPEPEPLEEPEIAETPEPEPVEEPEIAEAPEPEPAEAPEIAEAPEPEALEEPLIAETPLDEVLEEPQTAALPPPRPQRKPTLPADPLESPEAPLELPEPPAPETLAEAEVTPPGTAAVDEELPEDRAAYTHQGQIRDVAPSDLLANLAALGNESLQAEENPELWEIIRMVRSQVARCWQMNPQEPWDSKFTVDIDVAFDRGGTVTKAQVQQVARTVTDDDYRSFVVEARGALMDCSPFDLPQDRFAIWRSFTLRFVPNYRS